MLAKVLSTAVLAALLYANIGRCIRRWSAENESTM